MPKNATAETTEPAAAYIINPLDTLPDEGRERLDVLREAADAAGAETRRLSEAAADARRSLRKGERFLEEVERAYDDGHVTRTRRYSKPTDDLDDLKPKDDARDAKSPPWKRPQTIVEVTEVIRDDKRLHSEREAVAKVRRLFERAEAACEAARAKSQPLARLRMHVENYLAHQLKPHRPLPPYRGPAAKIKSGCDLVAEAARIAGQVAALAEEIADVTAALPTAAEQKAALAAMIDAQARRAQPQINWLENVAADHRNIWRQTEVRELTNVNADGSTGVVLGIAPDAIGLICWLHRDALLERLFAEIDAQADDSTALSTEEKSKRLDDLHSRLLAAERHEAALLFRALQDDLPIAPRPSLDPRAYLNLDSNLPPPIEG